MYQHTLNIHFFMVTIALRINLEDYNRYSFPFLCYFSAKIKGDLLTRTKSESQHRIDSKLHSLATNCTPDHPSMPPNHQTPKEVQISPKITGIPDHTSNPNSAPKGRRETLGAPLQQIKGIRIHQITPRNRKPANRKPEWNAGIAGLDLTSCSASGRHCISCSICASRPPQPPLSTFMGSMPRPPSSTRGPSSS